MLFIRNAVYKECCLSGMPSNGTRICASLGLLVQFETLFMSDEEKHGHHFDLPIFFNMSHFFAPGGLSAA